MNILYDVVILKVIKINFILWNDARLPTLQGKMFQVMTEFAYLIKMEYLKIRFPMMISRLGQLSQMGMGLLLN